VKKSSPSQKGIVATKGLKTITKKGKKWGRNWNISRGNVQTVTSRKKGCYGGGEGEPL